MVVLTRIPSQAIVSGFKGKVDFYVYRGTPCARSWPRSPGRRRAAAVEAQWPRFAEAARLWTQISPAVRDAYEKMASNTALTGRDLFTRGYLKGLYTYPTP